jgi:hypothetical protein
MPIHPAMINGGAPLRVDDRHSLRRIVLIGDRFPQMIFSIRPVSSLHAAPSPWDLLPAKADPRCPHRWNANLQHSARAIEAQACIRLKD